MHFFWLFSISTLRVKINANKNNIGLKRPSTRLPVHILQCLCEDIKTFKGQASPERRLWCVLKMFKLFLTCPLKNMSFPLYMGPENDSENVLSQMLTSCWLLTTSNSISTICTSLFWYLVTKIRRLDVNVTFGHYLIVTFSVTNLAPNQLKKVITQLLPLEEEDVCLLEALWFIICGCAKHTAFTGDFTSVAISNVNGLRLL